MIKVLLLIIAVLLLQLLRRERHMDELTLKLKAATAAIRDLKTKVPSAEAQAALAELSAEIGVGDDGLPLPVPPATPPAA